MKTILTREQILQIKDLRELRMSIPEMAERLSNTTGQKITPRLISYWVRRLKDQGHKMRKPITGRKPLVL